MHNCFKFLRSNKVTDNYDNYNIEIECIVCFNSYDSSNIKVFTPCGHRNCCDNCIEIMMDTYISNCPICKSKIDKCILSYENLILKK